MKSAGAVGNVPYKKPNVLRESVSFFKTAICSLVALGGNALEPSKCITFYFKYLTELNFLNIF